jgi:hypothetical protein
MTDSSNTIRNNGKEGSDEKNIEKIEKLKAGLFFTVITSFSILTGFGYSLSATKKKETKDYPKGLEKKLYNLHESGAELARRALLRATIYSVSGFSIFCFCIWKLSGANSFADFKLKLGTVFPKLSKPTDKQGRTEFENLTELLQFVIDEDKKKNNNNNNIETGEK